MSVPTRFCGTSSLHEEALMVRAPIPIAIGYTINPTMVDDIANLRNLTSALPGADSRLQMKSARLSDQIESQHFFFKVT